MATCPNCNKNIDDDSYYCEHCGTKLYACPKCHIIGKGEGKRCGQCGTKLVEASSIGQAAAGQPAQQPAQPVQQPIQQPGQPIQQPGQSVQQPIQQPMQQQPILQPGQQQQNSFTTSQAPVTSPGAAGSSIPPGVAGAGYGVAGAGYGVAGAGYGATGAGYGATGAGYGAAGAGYGAAVNNNNAQQSYQGTAVSSPAIPSSLYCAALNIRLPLFDGALIGRTTGNFVDQLSTCKYISGRHAQLSQTPNGWVITDLGSTNGTRVNGIPCAPSQPFTVGSIVRIANFYDFRAE